MYFLRNLKREGKLHKYYSDENGNISIRIKEGSAKIKLTSYPSKKATPRAPIRTVKTREEILELADPPFILSGASQFVDMEGWTVTNLKQPAINKAGSLVNVYVGPRGTGTDPNEAIYWEAPDSYLGNRVSGRDE